MNKFYRWMLPLLFFVVTTAPVHAQQRIIVRDRLGLTGIRATCVLLRCQSSVALGDPSGQLFLLKINTTLNPAQLLTVLLNQIGIVGAELDQQIQLIPATAGAVPESLLDETPLPYYGSAVWNGYATQPASQIIRLPQAQSRFQVTGAGIVAMIDTGVDTQHPALMPVLVAGYNFINNTPDGSETGTLNHSSAAVLDGGGPVYVNQSTIAILNHSSAAVLDQPGNSGFGHGTMTAGIVHLVAPTAQIMPLKAFGPDGTGYVSDIISAVYYAAQHGSKVISMSFSFSSSSTEMTNAISYATRKGIICVASAGNDGMDEVVFPAGIAGVMGVASTSNYDTRSSFSNYGSDVWVAAPGEGIITTYPYGTYSAGWGTSFSAPFVAGTAALLAQEVPGINQQNAASAIAHAIPLSGEMGHGRLDVYRALRAAALATQ